MLPRTTQQSSRPRVSDRTMVGISPPHCLKAQRHRTAQRNFMASTPIVIETRTRTLKPHTGAGCQSKTASLRKGKVFSLDSHFYRTPKALWKFSWFLRDFGYDAELFGREEIDDKALIGLSGVVKILHAVVNGRSLLN